MMSLFSSFDYFWLSFPLFIELSVAMCLVTYSFKLSSINLFLHTISKVLVSFFSSLKSSGHSKSSLPFFLVVMFLILFVNFPSVFPFVFAHTSQVSSVLQLSLGFWVGLMIFSSVNNIKSFLSHSIPEGTPMLLIPFLFLIELVSNLIRPVTLTVRLVANILAGHLLMILLSKVVYNNVLSYPFFLALNSVEFIVALIQAYIFTTMITLYYCETF